MGLRYSPSGRATVGASRETPRAPSTLDDDRPQIRLKRMGNPIWKPVDLHLFAAPIGSPDEIPPFPQFEETALALLNPGMGTEPHKLHPDTEKLFIGPGDPHGSPYNREFRNGVARGDFDENGPFTVADFSVPSAVWLVWMTVPRPGTKGSSPDFDSGRIINNDLFPFTTTTTTIRDGVPFSDPPDTITMVPPLDSVDPPFPGDGHSHFPEFYADNFFFAREGITDPVGSYTYKVKVIDKNGVDGWEFEADFVVVSSTDDDDDGDDD